MNLKIVYTFILTTIFLSSAADSSLTSSPLTSSQQKTFDSLTSLFPIYSCDSMPLAKAAKRVPACLMAKHLIPFAKWVAAKDKTLDVCKKQLADRQLSLSDPKRYSIDLTGVPIGGNTKAPVTIVLYLSGTCPLCKSIGCELYREVTSGMLKGKARFAVKPCKASIVDKALVAAAYAKKPWEYLGALNNVKIRPDEPLLIKLADSVGIDTVKFKKYLNSRELQSVIEGNEKEAGRNIVTYTPLIFINGKRYNSYTDIRWVVDAALYQNAMLTHKQ